MDNTKEGGKDKSEQKNASHVDITHPFLSSFLREMTK